MARPAAIAAECRATHCQIDAAVRSSAEGACDRRLPTTIRIQAATESQVGHRSATLRCGRSVRKPPVTATAVAAARRSAAPAKYRTGYRLLLRRGLDCARLQVLRVPGDVALVAILLEAWPADAVIFAGVDDQLGVAAEPFQSLIELLSADDRDVHVEIAAEDQRRRHDLVEPEERRDPHPGIGLLPWQAELRLPLPLIVIVAVVGEVVEFTRAGDRR